MIVFMGLFAALILAGLAYLLWGTGAIGSRAFNHGSRNQRSAALDHKEQRVGGID